MFCVNMFCFKSQDEKTLIRPGKLICRTLKKDKLIAKVTNSLITFVLPLCKKVFTETEISTELDI